MKKDTIYVNLLDDRIIATKESFLGIDFYFVTNRKNNALLSFVEAEVIENDPIWVKLDSEAMLTTPTVLAFRHKFSGRLFILVSGNNYRANVNGFFHYHSKETLLADTSFDVYQVQRNTDGEIFTLGDITEKGQITAFRAIGRTIGVKLNHGIETSVNNLKIAKALILKTEDGVPVYDPATILYSFNVETGEKNLFQPLRTKLVDNWVHFSTPEARELWIVKNLASFSYNDVMGFINIVMNGTINDITALKTQLLSKSKDVYDYATGVQ